MAYCVSGHSPHRARTALAPRTRGDRSLTRNALLASAALGCLTLAAGGALMFGGHRDSVPTRYVASHKALKIALVEPVQQAQFDRATNLAGLFVPPASAPPVKVAARTEPAAPAIAPAAVPAPALKVARVPLPAARPRQQVARIPLPRQRVAQPTDVAVVTEPVAAPQLDAPKTIETAPVLAAVQTTAPADNPAPAATEKPAEIVTAALEPPATESSPAPQPSPPLSLPNSGKPEFGRVEGEESAPGEPPPPLPPAKHIALMSFAPTREVLFDKEITGSIGNLASASPSPREEKPREAAPAAETTRKAVSSAKVAALPPAKAEKPKPHKLTLREKLWGPVRVASLAPYTPPTDNKGIPIAPYDRQTAVYVITDKKVYLPDGTVLEAHSGLGDKMDDPRFAHVRMRGVTPPHVYDLKMRESLFHGVEAIRMLPIGGEEAIHGRDGILAHTYMLGPSGQSNGCVSFKDYDTFLDAFKDGKITRLAVLARLD